MDPHQVRFIAKHGSIDRYTVITNGTGDSDNACFPNFALVSVEIYPLSENHKILGRTSVRKDKDPFQRLVAIDNNEDGAKFASLIAVDDRDRCSSFTGGNVNATLGNEYTSLWKSLRSWNAVSMVLYTIGTRQKRNSFLSIRNYSKGFHAGSNSFERSHIMKIENISGAKLVMERSLVQAI